MKSTDLNERVKTGADCVLRAQGLGVSVLANDRRLEVVGEVDLTLRRGRTTALVGESGCGKSITAAALGGLLPRGMRLDRGDIRWAGGGRADRAGGWPMSFKTPATAWTRGSPSAIKSAKPCRRRSGVGQQND
ncbi:MAG: ATP-binding cassette domain-containing protein [Kiritimatiellae bacterium]|nr:ATP-binding cassette domain-containing protein [Kiritimatiellia bacterium]